MSVAVGRDDTIAAIATAPGVGAVAIVRLSGREAHAIARRCGARFPNAPSAVVHTTVHAPDAPSEVIDDALVLRFDAPHSFTGEDVVEFQLHGGRVGPARMLAACVLAGAREALAGEFTERAVRHGRVDLLQGEAIGELIEARSRGAHAAALHQLAGHLTSRFGALRAALIALEGLVAYEIDFPAEDDAPASRAAIVARAEEVVASIDTLLAQAPAATWLRDGAMVVLAGAPNAGKSSLLNALVGAERAIVDATPGTTRDAVEVWLDDAPFALRLVDTAGWRESGDRIERRGVEIAADYARAAQLVLVCVPADVSADATVAAVREVTRAPLLVVHTKCDLAASVVPDAIATSAATGAGIDALRAAIQARLHATSGSVEAPILLRERHLSALTAARAAITTFAAAWREGALPAPVAATELRAAIHALDALFGAVDVEEILGAVFRQFCVGK